jgi:hypothetical protein
MWIITRGLVPGSRPRPDDSHPISHLFRPILSIAGSCPTSEVALIHEFVSGGTDGPPVDRLIELRCELLLRSSPGPHLHPIHVDYDLAIVLAIVLPTHTVIARGCSHHELFLLAWWSLRVGLS